MKLQSQRPSAASVREWLTLGAWERQKLGLSPAEYNALTPLEIACELKAQRMIERERRQALEVFDEHFARLEILANGYNFPELKTMEDFRILRRERSAEITDKQRRANNLKNIKMAMAMNEAVKRFKEKRAKLLLAQQEKEERRRQ